MHGSTPVSPNETANNSKEKIIFGQTNVNGRIFFIRKSIKIFGPNFNCLRIEHKRRGMKMCRQNDSYCPYVDRLF